MTCRHLARPTEPSAYSPKHLCLCDLVHRPMPRSVRGALLRSVPPLPTQPIRTVWMTGTAAAPLRPGSILLSWESNLQGGMDVTARLGLVATEVLLANWPGLHGDWSPVVHPTLLEVTGLHAALSVATDALRLANDLAAH